MPENLSDDDARMVRSLLNRLLRLRRTHKELQNYYEGKQRIQSIGIAVPPQLQPFVFPINWPRVTVDTIVQRQSVRSFSVPDDDGASKMLRELWESNNMESQQVLNHTETRVQGHGFVSVATNPDDKAHPFIRVESAKNLIAKIDPRTRQIECALRVYYDPWDLTARPEYITLYRPDYTLWLEKAKGGKWVIEDRDDHELHRVPIVQFLNRPHVGDFLGESEMTDVMRPTDVAARAILDLQIAMETHAVPGKWAAGISDNQIIDPKTGEPVSPLKAYFNSMLKTKNDKAKFGQFTASDLKNFKTVIDTMAEQVSAVTGLPMRYFGQNTANPAAEGAIRADENRLVRNVELKNSVDGDSWSSVMALAYRFATGKDVNANLVRTDWEDPSTPTYSQRSDAIQKLVSVNILSREGSWDELGWSPARKDKEREYFKAQLKEAFDPYVKQVDDATDNGGPDSTSPSNQTGQEPAQAQQPAGTGDSEGMAQERKQ